MDKDDNVIKLHYNMLNYIFSERKYSRSCFDETWQIFKDRDASKFTQGRNERELKMEFFKKILPNIEEYDALTKEQKEYFHYDNFGIDVDDGFLETIENNDVMRGEDYIYWKSRKDYINSPQTRVTRFGELKNVFKKPTVVEEFDIKINIIDDVSSFSLKNIKVRELNIDKTFQTALVTENDKTYGCEKLSREEVMIRLADEKFLSAIDNLGELPKHYINYFKQTNVGLSLEMEDDGELSDNEDEEHNLTRAISESLSTIVHEQISMPLSIKSLESSAQIGESSNSLKIPQFPLSFDSSRGIMTRSRSENLSLHLSNTEKSVLKGKRKRSNFPMSGSNTRIINFARKMQRK